MNLLGAIAPASVPIDPLQPISAPEQQVALLVAAKMLDAQRAAGAQVIALLDPNVGRNLNASA